MLRSLRAKVMLGFTIVVLLVTFIAAWTVMNVSEVGKKIVAIGTWDFGGAEASDHMRLLLAKYHTSVLRYIIRQDDSIRADVSHRQGEFFHWLDQAKEYPVDTADQQILAQVEALFHNLNVRFTHIAEMMVMPGDSGGVIVYYQSEFMPGYLRLMNILDGQVERSHARTAEHITSIRSMANFIGYSTLVIAVIVLVISVIASQKILQTILHPIHQLTYSAQRVAAGDFEQEIKAPGSNDELKVLVNHFNQMVRQLRHYDAMKVNQIVAEKRRCETIVRDLSDAIVATDQEGKIIYFNRQAEEVIGLPARLAVGSLLGDLATERPFIRRVYGDIAGGITDGRDEALMISVNGEARSYSYESQTIRDEENEILGYVFRLKDITRFRQLDEMKNKMVSTVSHELRTPLTSMGMSLELLLEEGREAPQGPGPMRHELLETMQEDVQRLQGFVNDLLDISRIESGKVRLNLQASAPRHLADAAARRIAPLAGRHEIQIDTTGIDAGLPHVLADADRIAQVFSNLYGNAIRYTPFRGTIEATAEIFEEMVRFCVRDNGPGIPPQEAKHIFEKFYQVRDDQRAGGSGLGLAIVKEIVEAHGGSVWVESAVGRGSSFYFTLKLV